MIVTLTATGYDAIFQPAHGLLAAKLAYHWRAAERPRYWLELLTAVANHDNNQRDFRGRDYLTEAGAPRGFTVSKSEAAVSSLDQPRQTVQAVRLCCARTKSRQRGGGSRSNRRRTAQRLTCSNGTAA